MSDRTLIRHLASPDLYDDSEHSEFAIDTDSSYELKYRANATDRRLVTTDHTQTLTNKTLSTPTLTDASITDATFTDPKITSAGLSFLDPQSDILKLAIKAQTSNNHTLFLPDLRSLDGGGIVVAHRSTFNVTDGHDSAVGTSTATLTLPPFSIIFDILIYQEVNWNAGTSTTLKVGDSDNDDDGFFTGVDLQGTDIAVGEVLSAMHGDLWGGVNGAYLVAATGRRGRTDSGFAGLLANSTGNVPLTAAVTTVGTVPTTGVTHMVVLWAMTNNNAPTFVAT